MLVGHAVGGETALKHLVYVQRIQRVGVAVPLQGTLQQLFPLLSGDVRDYDEGDTVAVGGLTVTVLATPGHSEGSVTLRCQDALFCGDTLFAGSCGRTDFVGGSMTTLMDSLARLGRLTGNYRVLPGHMEPSDLDTERRMNPYLIQAMRK